MISLIKSYIGTSTLVLNAKEHHTPAMVRIQTAVTSDGWHWEPKRAKTTHETYLLQNLGQTYFQYVP